MATNLTAIMRDSNANAVDDVSRLLVKINATGTPSAIFVVTVPTSDDERADSVRNMLANDPHILAISF